jgi:hypothetical protein
VSGSFWGGIAWLLFIFACVAAAGITLGYLIHWCLEWRDARRARRGTLPR